MTKAELDALPAAAVQPTEQEKERLFASSRNYSAICERAYKSMSGADVADAPKHQFTASALSAIGAGKDVDAVIVLFATKWRTYATENNRKVAEAAKIKRGPRAGQSVIEHRYTNPEAFDSIAIFLRQMAPKGEATT